MDSENHLEIYERAIRRTFPDLKSDFPLLIEDEYDELYFCDRKINFYRSTEDFYSVEFRIKRFRSRFYISGYIDKVSITHQVTRYPVSTALKVGHKHKGTADILEKIGELKDSIKRVNSEVMKIQEETMELKNISSFCQTPRSTTDSYYVGNYPYSYPSSVPSIESDYVEMSPRVPTNSNN